MEKSNKEQGSIHAKMVAVMGEVNRLPKNGYNSFHKYKYATSEDVADCVRSAMAKHGLAFLPSVDEVTRDKDITRMCMTMRFLDSETGQILESPWVAEAGDKGDKGINKCITAGVKYFLLKTFIISSGDEEDADSTSHEAPNTSMRSFGKKKNPNDKLRKEVLGRIKKAKDKTELRKIGIELQMPGVDEALRKALRPEFSARMAELTADEPPPVDDAPPPVDEDYVPQTEVA